MMSEHSLQGQCGDSVFYLPSGEIGISSKTILDLAKVVQDDPSALVWTGHVDLHPPVSSQQQYPDVIEIQPGRVALIPEELRMIVDDETLNLTPLQVGLLALFATNPNLLLVNKTLYEGLRQSGCVNSDINNALRVTVMNLRRILRVTEAKIEVHRSVGFRFIPYDGYQDQHS